jgi:hypothetical protein
MDGVWWHSMPKEIYFENTFSNFIPRLEQLLSVEGLRQQCFADVDRLTRKQLLWSKIVEYLVAQTLETSTKTPVVEQSGILDA